MGIKWEATADKLPKHNQWVVIHTYETYQVGQFDSKHPFGPVVINRETGRWWSGFTHWSGLKPPSKDSN